MSKQTKVQAKPAQKKVAAPKKVAKKVQARKVKAPKVKAPKLEAPAAPPRETKKTKALEMLARGTTLSELMEAFGWLRHTTRGFLSVLGKTHKLETYKNEKGEHTYKLGAA